MDFIKELKAAIEAQFIFPVFQTLSLGIYVPFLFVLIFHFNDNKIVELIEETRGGTEQDEMQYVMSRCWSHLRRQNQHLKKLKQAISNKLVGENCRLE
jgi:hypothetical protein